MKLEIGFSIIAINLVLGCTLSEIPEGDRCPESGVISDVKVYIYKDGMGEGPHFAQVRKNDRKKIKNIAGSKDIMSLAGAGAEPRLNSLWFTS